MNNTTSTTRDGKGTHANTAIAIVLPSLFAIVLVILVAIALLLPHLNPTESAESKDERRKRRVARLDKLLKAQKYTEWATKQAAEHPELPVALNPLCVICLEEVEDASQIRGLNCLHVFHQQCLDDWFGRWNEYCPLCHRPIITSAEAEAKKQPDSSRPGDGGGLVTAAAMV